MLMLPLQDLIHILDFVVVLPIPTAEAFTFLNVEIPDVVLTFAFNNGSDTLRMTLLELSCTSL